MTDEKRQQRPPPPTGPAVDDEDPDMSPMDRERGKDPQRDKREDPGDDDQGDRRKRD